jgi:GNAT superfamily N-acetyltransferase
MAHEIRRGDYRISTDKSRLDLRVIHGFLSSSYWAEGIPLDVVIRCIEHSLCFGVYHNDEQVGFARVITDYSTFAYIADVFIVEPHRGKGLGKRLMESIMGHGELRGLRRWMLATKDAQGLYEQFGFSAVSDPRSVMELRDPDVYKR